MPVTPTWLGPPRPPGDFKMEEALEGVLHRPASYPNCVGADTASQQAPVTGKVTSHSRSSIVHLGSKDGSLVP